MREKTIWEIPHNKHKAAYSFVTINCFLLISNRFFFPLLNAQRHLLLVLTAVCEMAGVRSHLMNTVEELQKHRSEAAALSR